MDGPKELSLSEIRKYMLENGCRVTNHALVKYFKRFLTHPDTQNEARKEFKTYVNILATIKNENNQKYLILRKKYINECPSEDMIERSVTQAGGPDSVPNSPGGVSVNSEGGAGSPYRQPPPYKPPPEVSSPLAKASSPSLNTGVSVQAENLDNYRECVNEFTNAMSRINPKRLERQTSGNEAQTGPKLPEDTKRKGMESKANRDKSVSRGNSVDESPGNKENIPRFAFSSASTDAGGEKSSGPDVDTENPISVKEATRKFNRMASEEEAKVISPPSKKKPEMQLIEEKELPEVTLAHPKAKEWIVSMAKASYQELAKLANEYPELVKLHDPSTGYTALHWAAKHGNEDVVKLIAGTYKADVNAQTNGGYTPLHIAMQFGRSNIFALLCNTYKANRDIFDWAGNKPLEYSKQQTSVSASTYSSEYCSRFLHSEINYNYHFEHPLNMRNISNTGKTAAGGGTVGSALVRGKKRSQLTGPLTRTQSLLTQASSTRRSKKPTMQSLKFNNDDGNLVPCEAFPSPQRSPELTPPSLSPKDIRQGTVARRKESFLRKTLRAATASRSNNNPDNVTNQPVME